MDTHDRLAIRIVGGFLTVVAIVVAAVILVPRAEPPPAPPPPTGANAAGCARGIDHCPTSETEMREAIDWAFGAEMPRYAAVTYFNAGGFQDPYASAILRLNAAQVDDLLAQRGLTRADLDNFAPTEGAYRFRLVVSDHRIPSVSGRAALVWRPQGSQGTSYRRLYLLPDPDGPGWFAAGSIVTR